MNGFLRFFASAFGGFFDKRLWRSVGSTRRTVSREEVSEDSALNYSAVWCATRLLCGTGASLPLPIYIGRDSEDRTKDRAHPVYRLLNGNPNPEHTAYNFRSVMWQWQVNWGNAYAEIVREGGNPFAPVVELWPIHPARVTVQRDENDDLYYEVQNFGRAPSQLDPWQMLHIPSIITYDGTMGRGVIAHARECIGAGIAAEKYGANFFGGGAMPQLVVKHAGNWNPEARKAFKDEWEEIHSGADGSRLALLQGGAEVEKLSFTAQDSQFIESRQFSIEEIARWYGIPPHLLQHLLRATFNNVEELGINFVQYSLITWLRVWEQAIWQKLFTPDEQETYFAEHNVDALLRGNAAARASFYQSMTSAALMTRNECRKLENLDPVDGGDTFLVQGAMVPLDEDGKPESKFVQGDSAPQTPPEQPADDEEEPEDEPADEQPAEDVSAVKAELADSMRRVLMRDLARLMTKEAKSLIQCAKKPESFLNSVDLMYAEHKNTLRDAVLDTVKAIAACGVPADCEAMLSAWVAEGRALMLSASETSPAELGDSVQRVIESQTWVNRPQVAVERLKNATLGV